MEVADVMDRRFFYTTSMTPHLSPFAAELSVPRETRNLVGLVSGILQHINVNYWGTVGAAQNNKKLHHENFTTSTNPLK